MDIEVNKLRKAISIYEDERISNALNEIIGLFNHQINEVSKERNSFQSELEELHLLQ